MEDDEDDDNTTSGLVDKASMNEEFFGPTTIVAFQWREGSAQMLLTRVIPLKFWTVLLVWDMKKMVCSCVIRNW